MKKNDAVVDASMDTFFCNMFSDNRKAAEEIIERAEKDRTLTSDKRKEIIEAAKEFIKSIERAEQAYWRVRSLGEMPQ